MKHQTTKKLFAFITIMTFFSLTQFAFAQKKCKNCTYDCLCGARGYGCTTNACRQYCAAACNLLNTPDNEISLKSIYNPDSQSATISFSIPQSAKVALKIFDVDGILLKTLADGVFEEGEHSIEWSTAEVNEGVYFGQLQSGTFSKIEKLTVSK